MFPLFMFICPLLTYSVFFITFCGIKIETITGTKDNIEVQEKIINFVCSTLYLMHRRIIMVKIFSGIRNRLIMVDLEQKKINKSYDNFTHELNL